MISDSNGSGLFLSFSEGEQPKQMSRNERIMIALMIVTKNGLWGPMKISPTDRSVNFISLILFSLGI